MWQISLYQSCRLRSLIVTGEELSDPAILIPTMDTLLP